MFVKVKLLRWLLIVKESALMEGPASYESLAALALFVYHRVACPYHYITTNDAKVLV